MLFLRTIYRCIELALQWYKCFSETGMEKFFEMNTYDRYVINKLVNIK